MGELSNVTLSWLYWGNQASLNAIVSEIFRKTLDIAKGYSRSV